MPAISNTSPLLNLSIDEPRPGSVYLQDAIKEGWLVLHPVNNTPLISLLQQKLHQGEAEAIALAVELSATKILLDEKEARQAARTLGLSITGILGILLRGWCEGSITSIKTVRDHL